MLVVISTHMYLIAMGFTIQRILREYGFIEGYKGEILLICIYTIHFLSNMIRQFIIMPALLLRIDTSSYECSHQVTGFMQVLYLTFRVGWPLGYQILFMTVMRQLSRVQNESKNQDSFVCGPEDAM